MNNPAFPHFNQHGEVIHDSAIGITRLEYFTAAAMQGLAANPKLMEETLNAGLKGADLAGMTVPELAVKMAIGAIKEIEKIKDRL